MPQPMSLRERAPSFEAGEHCGDSDQVDDGRNVELHRLDPGIEAEDVAMIEGEGDDGEEQQREVIADGEVERAIFGAPAGELRRPCSGRTTEQRQPPCAE